MLEYLEERTSIGMGCGAPGLLADKTFLQDIGLELPLTFRDAPE
jgi:hypothetical protein